MNMRWALIHVIVTIFSVWISPYKTRYLRLVIRLDSTSRKIVLRRFFYQSDIRSKVYRSYFRNNKNRLGFCRQIRVGTLRSQDKMVFSFDQRHFNTLRPIHTERKQKRKRKFSLMFEFFSPISFAGSLIFFAFTFAFAWCERALRMRI